MKRLLSRFVLFLTLCSLIVSLPKINMVDASGTVYIRADGSVEGTDKIHRDGNIYAFTGKISIDSGDCGIQVDRDNIVVDGAGFALQGTAAYISRGIDLSGRSNVTIKNMEIRNFMDGIYLVPSSNNTITQNNITANTDSGIWTAGVSNNITGNYIANNNIGILFEGSHDLIYHNNFINNTKQVEDICWSNPWLPCSANILDDSYPSGGNYWSDYEERYPNASELDDSSIWNIPYVIDANNQDRYPLMKPIVIVCVPTISIISPENKTYTVNNVSLTFTVDKSTSWIGYSLDGQANITISGNTTLTGLSDGSHNITVYATDILGNIGSSVRVHFTIDTTLPSISILSPQNKTYDTTGIPLNFTVNEPVSWIAYSLDGQTNVTITGNTTITGLPYGHHSLVVYATDTDGNTGASETVYFSIETQPSEPFPITWVAATIAIIVIVGVALLVYFAKVKKTTGKSE